MLFQFDADWHAPSFCTSVALYSRYPVPKYISKFISLHFYITLYKPFFYLHPICWMCLGPILSKHWNRRILMLYCCLYSTKYTTSSMSFESMLPCSTVLLSDSLPCLFPYPWYVCQSYLCANACTVAHQTPSTSWIQNMYEYFLLAKALNYVSPSYNHPVLIEGKNLVSSSSKSSDKLVSSWPGCSKVVGDGLIRTQHC